MRVSIFLHIEDLRVGDGQGVKDVDFNTTVEMSTEEFSGYIAMVPELVNTLVGVIQKES